MFRSWPGVGLLLVTVACVGSTSGLNTPVAVTQATILAALEADDIDVALAAALDFERRLPGADSWGMLGRALWRSGDFLQAEGFFRRARAAGSAEGPLGLARGAAARGRFDEARTLAEQAAESAAVESRARGLLAALDWRTGDPVAAAEQLRRAAEATPDVTRRAAQRQRAAVIDDMVDRVARSAFAPARPVSWSGTGSILRLRRTGGGAPLVTVAMGGEDVVLALRLDAPRSYITVATAQRLGLSDTSSDAGLVLADLQLGEVRGFAVPIHVLDRPGMEERQDEVDGEIGFDLLATLRWIFWPLEDRWYVAPEGSDIPASLRPAVSSTYWASIKVPIDGLDAQLYLQPRINGMALNGLLGDAPQGTISPDGHAVATRHGPASGVPALGDSLALATRLGSLETETLYTLGRLSDRSARGAAAPQVVLGLEALQRRGLSWTPGHRQVALVERGSVAGR